MGPRRINGTRCRWILVKSDPDRAADRRSDPPRPVKCPHCTAEDLIEPLERGWMFCNICAKTFRVTT